MTVTYKSNPAAVFTASSNCMSTKTDSINSFGFGKKEYKNPFGPIDYHYSRDELVIKQTKKAIFKDAVLGVAATCLLYFRIKNNFVSQSVRRSVMKNYERVRVGQPPKLFEPLETYLFRENHKAEIKEKLRKELIGKPGIEQGEEFEKKLDKMAEEELDRMLFFPKD